MKLVYSKSINQNIVDLWAVIVAQLEERSLPTPKDLDLKAVIGIEDLLTVRKRQR